MQKNRKYQAATFVFAVLFDQFKYFLNLFYLCLTLTQFVDFLKVGELFTYNSPRDASASPCSKSSSMI